MKVQLFNIEISPEEVQNSGGAFALIQKLSGSALPQPVEPQRIREVQDQELRQASLPRYREPLALPPPANLMDSGIESNAEEQYYSQESVKPRGFFTLTPKQMMRLLSLASLGSIFLVAFFYLLPALLAGVSSEFSQSSPHEPAKVEPAAQEKPAEKTLEANPEPVFPLPAIQTE